MIAAAPASAATQGTLGATSTGNITITVSVPSRVQITGLTDVAFTNVDPTDDRDERAEQLRVEQHRDQGLYDHRHG